MEKDAKIPFKVSAKTNGMIRHNCATRAKMTDIITFEKRYSSQNNLYILVLYTYIQNKLHKRSCEVNLLKKAWLLGWS